MTVREIQSHLEEMYGTEASPTLISSVTDAVMDEVRGWQARALDALYPIVYLDCIHAKVRERCRSTGQGRLSGIGGEPQWRQGIAGPVGGPNRGRQVLAAGRHRA